MRYADVIIVIVFATFYLDATLSIIIVPERTEVTDINEKYVYNVSAHVVRYGRKSAYYYNLIAGLKHTWGNNITIHLVFFESQIYQYKRSLLELHLKLCDLFQRDQYFGKLFTELLTRFGVSCPFLPGMYYFMNATLHSEKLPNFLPFQKGKLEMTFSQLPTQDIIAKLLTTITIKTS